MNLGLTTSFIIGGLLMILIVTLNVRMGQHGAELTLHEMTKTHIEALYEIVENDFRKIAYNLQQPIEDAIKVAEDHKITFESNLFDSTNVIYTIDFDFQKDEEQRVGVLERSVSSSNYFDQTEIEVGVTRFELRYYTLSGTEPMPTPVASEDLDDIRRIEVIIETQPRAGVVKGGSTFYPTSQWRKVFVPRNLNL
jgi:hypothetical protein